MILVEYLPGSQDPIHRHNAHALVYVLEGSIVMLVKGGKQVTLTAGQTFLRSLTTRTFGRNISNTKPARFVVFLVKDRVRRFWCPRSEQNISGDADRQESLFSATTRLEHLRSGVQRPPSNSESVH